mmetsp:Transcript_30888/g.75501  ORF Transcript_30888/g.75501 Transcript_30888/m.75501 type:complete len:348 (-) Transcript_30888:1144-2187(-)
MRLGCFEANRDDDPGYSPVSPHQEEIDKLAATASLLNDKYSMGMILGVGNFAEVYMGYQKDSSEPVAIKKFFHRPNDSEMRRCINQEMAFFKLGLEHEHCVKTFEVVRDENTSCLVLEVMPGGDLQQRLDHRARFHEPESKNIMARILSALAFLHENRVIHRDLKPENVLFQSDMDGRAKLADFGLCHIFPADGSRTKTDGLYGTPYFVAPEIARNEWYDYKVDVWSAGVMMYYMLSGELPFFAMSSNGVLRKVKKAAYNFKDPVWNTVSFEAKDLISKMMEVDPDRRLSAAKTLDHPWLNDAAASSRPASPQDAGLPDGVRSPNRVTAADALFEANSADMQQSLLI